MMPMRHALLLLPLAGCKPVLKGWWTIDRWEIVKDGEKPLLRDDAGMVVWQAEGANAGFGAVHVILRYDYDPVAFTLEPDPDPEQTEQSWNFDEWQDDQPIELGWSQGDTYVSVAFELLDYQPQAMTLEGPSPDGDPSTWTWSLAR